MSSQVSYEGGRKESIFYFRTLRLLWLDCFYPLNPASSGPECSRYQQVHVILSTNRFGHIELRPKTPQPYPLPPRLCLWLGSVCLFLSVSVCLTLVQLGLVSPWSHQSAWRPVKAISPSWCATLCQLGACVSSLGLTHSPAVSILCSRTHGAKATRLPHKQTPSFACP